MSSSKQLKWGILISYVAIGINILTGLLYTPWMIHSIGRENFGLYTLSLSVISLFVFDFGLSAAVTRFIAKYVAEGRLEKANQCYGLVYRLYIVLDILLLAILLAIFFFIPQIYQELTPDEIEKFKVVYCITSLYSIFSFPFIPLNGILMAYEKVIQLKLCDVFHKLIIVGAMSVCLIIGLGLYALVAVNAVSGIVTIVLKLFCVKKYTNQSVDWKYFNQVEFKEIVGYSGWVTIISLAQRCVFSIAPSILGALSGSTSIAILGIAITLEGYTYTVANAMNGVFLPKISKIMYQGDGDVLPLMVRVARLQIYVIGLVVLGVVCFGRSFIDLWVGDSFTGSYICAILIIVPSLFQLPQEIGLQAIHVKNKVKPLARVFVCMAIISLVFSLMLAKPFGAIGIGISVFLAYILRTIGMDVILYRYLNINVFVFFKESFVKQAIPLFICLIVGLAIENFLSVAGWIGFIIKGGMFCVCYGLINYTLAMTDSEKQLILVFISKVFKLI
ncbi:oligosaccharide flippase family protein [uncultured Parabacteroides sp.]|uniref:oligosaccharide flippase family protein n=1 Tax=uncultured Parabacteroides sp. TaxID=512312 RepID=UPI0026155C06|nr:oligosaccharide flippase family protein [uncultured Parabacteroides sp.]